MITALDIARKIGERGSRTAELLEEAGAKTFGELLEAAHGEVEKVGLRREARQVALGGLMVSLLRSKNRCPFVCAHLFVPISMPSECAH